MDDRKGFMNNSELKEVWRFQLPHSLPPLRLLKTIEYLTDKEFFSSRILNIMLSKTMG